MKIDWYVQAYMQMDGMRFRLFIMALAAILLFINCSSFFNFNETCRADTPPTLYVGSGELYTTISSAIENASAGYRIVVYNGTYYENITIDKKLDLFGEDRSITIINGNGVDTVVTVNASHVNISHFTIKNSGSTNNDSMIQVNYGNSIITDNNISNGYHGIILNNSDGHLIYDNNIIKNSGDGIRLNQSDSNANISYNTITQNNNGIYFNSSDGNKIYNNNIKNNDANGIFFNNTCDNNYIVNNNVSNNNNHGIYLNDYSNYSIIKNNQIYSNNNSGMVLENCSWSTINTGNIVSGNTNYGIMIVGSNNVIQSNTVSYNSKDGFYLTADNNNTVSSNTIGYNALAGIKLYNSTADYIYTNEILNNSQYGAYLDFFSINNQIYNNYFHDNTQNAMDKSQSRNTWNIAKTSGTNIVGGSYLSGNYWDDYDEVSEGATDSNGDGIADSAYSINVSSSDGGPLLDVTLPSIGTPSISPSSQSLGGYTNVSVTVSDNMEVREVYLNITDPNGQTSNFSITQNKTGTTYYCRKQFSPIGTHNFFIAAKDPRNWATSSNGTLYINEGTPPTIVDKTPTTGSPYRSFTFNATVTDDGDTASQLGVYVIWDHGNEGGNHSLTITGGNSFEKTVTLARSTNDLTYHYYARDHWGNAVVGDTSTVTVTDTTAPSIKIKKHGPSFDNLPNSYTFAATVTDNLAVSNVYIKYWYNGSSNMTVDMDNMGNNYYQKVIVPEGSPDRVYCIIYANDTSENLNNTMSPTANHSGPYSGFMLEEITFNGSGSFDLDGSIATYSWNFGDGTTGSSSNATNVYYSNGNYTVTLTVTDNDGRTDVNITYVNVFNFTKIEASNETVNNVSSDYNITLTENFYSYDTDGDEMVDTFVDPNSVLTAIHTGHYNLSGNICFFVSVDDEVIPEFIWNSTTDKVIPISHTRGVVDDIIIDEENEQATIHIIVDKSDWIFIEIDDEYPDSSLTVTTNSRTISSDRIWRENGKIYVLDDPETEYQFIFEDIFPALESPTFSPVDGGVINENSTTITISYNVPVTITYAAFKSIRIESELVTTDNQIFSYAPPAYWEDGTYAFEIDAQALQGSDYDSSSVSYFYFAYAEPPQQSFIEKNWMFIVFGSTIGALAAVLIFFRYKQVTIDNFIYIKNKKILPFFKTIIVGPVSINVDNKDISKAEFYVDGQLKNTISNYPYLWKWNEKAFMRHTLETKTFDQEGKSTSSGEMTFYIFNPFQFK